LSARRKLGIGLAAAASLLAALLLVPPAGAAPPIGDGIGGFALTPIGSFDEPTDIVQAPGKKNRRLLFVVEQDGRLVVLRNGVPQPGPFLDISARVSNIGEQGMLSVAFHPRYERNRRFYVYFTNLNGDNEVVEFKRSKRSRLRAAAGPGRLVLYLPHPTFGNHNGGDLEFGSKELLFIGPGDGGGGGDPFNNAQNPSSLLGKLLRIDPLPSIARKGKRKKGKRKKDKRRAATAKARRPYTIPKGNPFARGGGRPEVFALGLRNPFRFTFDSLTGAISIGDVGQSCREEIDYLLAGRLRGVNFGWARFEGNFLYDATRSAPGAVPPIHEYDNGSGSGGSGNCTPLGNFTGAGVIAGYVVRDPRLTHQYGRLLYSDLANPEIHSLIPSEQGASGDRYTGISVPGGNVDSFGQTRNGVLYVVSHSGPIYRLDPA
jgi:glucose/arabinose dehydrogenase